MKAIATLIFFWIFFAIHTITFAQSVLIHSGDYFDFHVSSLTPVGPSDQMDIGTLMLNFHGDLLDPGETIYLIVSQTPITDPNSPGVSFTQGLLEPSLGGFALMQREPFWPDLPGYLRVQMQSGSVELSGISIEQIVNGEIYSGAFAAPEPSTFAFATLGFTLFGIVVRWKRLSPPN